MSDPTTIDSPQKASTRDRILQAARELFAEGGYAGVSVRDVTSRANVSLSSINYHFGGKDELVEAIVTYSWTQVASEIYDEFLRQDRAKLEPSFERFATAVVKPLATRAFAGDAHALEIVQLIVKGYGKRRFDEMPRDIRIAWRALGRELIRRLKILRPELPDMAAGYRIHCTLGVLLHSVMHLPDIHVILGSEEPDNYDEAIEHMITYCAAGLAS